MATKWDDFEPVSATPSSVNWADFSLLIRSQPEDSLLQPSRPSAQRSRAPAKPHQTLSRASRKQTLSQPTGRASSMRIRLPSSHSATSLKVRGRRPRKAVGNAAGSMVSMVGGALGAKALGGDSLPRRHSPGRRRRSLAAWEN